MPGSSTTASTCATPRSERVSSSGSSRPAREHLSGSGDVRREPAFPNASSAAIVTRILSPGLAVLGTVTTSCDGGAAAMSTVGTSLNNVPDAVAVAVHGNPNASLRFRVAIDANAARPRAIDEAEALSFRERPTANLDGEEALLDVVTSSSTPAASVVTSVYPGPSSIAFWGGSHPQNGDGCKNTTPPSATPSRPAS